MIGLKDKKSPVNERWVFLTVCIGVFMSTMDSSMVNVALPVLMKTFSQYTGFDRMGCVNLSPDNYYLFGVLG
jgi:MFS family permease